MERHFHSHETQSKHGGSMQGMAWFYDGITGVITLGREKRVRRYLIEQVNIQPGQRILEVGCGTGAMARLAKAKTGPRGEVVGVDIAPDMIAAAQRKAQRAGLALTLHLASADAIPEPAASFDQAYSSFAFHHLPGDDLKRRALAEIARVLKPGGRLLIADFEPPKKAWLRHLITLFLGPTMLNIDNRDVVRLLQASGYQNVKMLPSSYSWIALISAEKPA